MKSAGPPQQTTERPMTGVERQTRENALAIGDADLLRKLIGFAVYSSVNGHAQTPVFIAVNRRHEHQRPLPPTDRIS